MKKIFLLIVLNYVFLQSQNLFAQNVGIGISNPTLARLEVHGAVGNTSAIFGTESSGISLQRNSSIGFNQYNNAGSRYLSNGFASVQYLDPATGNLVFDMFPNGVKDAIVLSVNRALVIGNNGNIGIRTTPVNASLYVVKAGNFDGTAVLGGTHYNSHFNYSTTEDTYIRSGLAGGHVFINDLFGGKVIMGRGNSYVGINTSNPVYPLEIRQTGLTGIMLVAPENNFNNWEQVVGLYNSGPESSLKLLYNGVLKSFFRPTDGAFVTASDRRLKTNIQPFTSILDKIMQLRPVEYEAKFNNPDHDKTIGFIAQEVKQVFPELVHVTSNKLEGETIADFHSLNYNGFNVLAVKAVQEEQILIEDLQSKQNEMKRRMDIIEKKLSIKK